MTYVSTHHLASACADDPSTDRAQNAIATFIYSIGDLFRRVSRRRYLATFDKMSGQQLSDIGLYHDDIFEAATLGYDRDVTCYLAEVALRRRQGKRQSGVRALR